MNKPPIGILSTAMSPGGAYQRYDTVCVIGSEAVDVSNSMTYLHCSYGGDMRTSVQKWGNSLAVRIPKAFATDLGIDQNGSVDLSMEDGALILRPVRVDRYDLESLLKEVTDENIHAVVDWGAPVGRELL